MFFMFIGLISIPIALNGKSLLEALLYIFVKLSTSFMFSFMHHSTEYTLLSSFVVL